MNEIEVQEYILAKAEELREYLGLSENKFAEQVLHMDKSVWSKMKSNNYSINSKRFKKLIELLNINIEVVYEVTEHEIDYEKIKKEFEETKRGLEKDEIRSEIARLQSRLKELSES